MTGKLELVVGADDPINEDVRSVCLLSAIWSIPSVSAPPQCCGVDCFYTIAHQSIALPILFNGIKTRDEHVRYLHARQFNLPRSAIGSYNLGDYPPLEQRL